MTRLLPDPPSRSGRMLTKSELDAALRVLAALRRPQPASILMSWDNDMQDALSGLQRARYVETRPAYEGRMPKATASFRPDMLATTDLGGEYLDSIKKSGGASHATRKRKTDKQLDREIAEALAKKPADQWTVHDRLTVMTPAAKKRELKDLQRAKERYFQSLGYAGNTPDQVRKYHDAIDEIEAKMRLFK